MLDYIERLRNLPEPQRRKKAFFIALSVTVGIAVVWGVVITLRIGATDFRFRDEFPGKDATPSLGQTFSNFGDRMKEIFNRGSGGTGTTSAR